MTPSKQCRCAVALPNGTALACTLEAGHADERHHDADGTRWRFVVEDGGLVLRVTPKAKIVGRSCRLVVGS